MIPISQQNLYGLHQRYLASKANRNPINVNAENLPELSKDLIDRYDTKLNKPDVIDRKEQLIAFLTWLEEEPDKEMIEKIVDHYLEKQ
jgi:hypothetical protein